MHGGFANRLARLNICPFWVISGQFGLSRFTSKGKRDRDVRFVPQADITERWQPGDSVRDHACKVAC